MSWWEDITEDKERFWTAIFEITKTLIGFLGTEDSSTFEPIDTTSYPAVDYGTYDQGSTFVETGHHVASASDLHFGSGPGDYIPGYTYSPSTGLYYDSPSNFNHDGPGETYWELQHKGKV